MASLIAPSEEAASSSSMEEVLHDGGVVSNIVSRLQSAQDRYGASLVCKLWHDAVTWQASKLVLRTRSSLPRLVKLFKHILVLDLSCVDEELGDGDLEYCGRSFGFLRSLTLGHPDLQQTKITNAGIVVLAGNCAFLEHLSLACISRLEDSGLQAFGTSCPLLRSVTLHSCRKLTDAALEVLWEFPALVELQLKGRFEFTSSGLEKVGIGGPKLLNVLLELGDVNIEPALKSLVEGCPKLQGISVKAKKVDLNPLVDCTSLISLSVESDQTFPMDRPVLLVCTANKNLRELTVMNRFAALSDSAVIGIIRGLKLEKLCLDATNLSGAAVHCIASCQTLRHLTLENLRVTTDGLAEIGICSAGLKSLALRYPRGFRDMELQSLVSLNRDLEILDLHGCGGVTSVGFPAIATCKHLQVLDLSYTQVDDANLLAIAREIQNLKKLSLIRCKEVISMESVVRFTSLETLNIEQCQFVSDRSLEFLALHCPRLADLNIAYTMVSDKGLVNICGCSLLRSLRVTYCQYVKGPGLIRVARSCIWFQHITISHKFRRSKFLEELRELSCRVTLEMDEMALVPFGNGLF